MNKIAYIKNFPPKQLRKWLFFFFEIILKVRRGSPAEGTGWLSWVSSSSYLDFLIRELFLSTEPLVTATFAKSCVNAKCQKQTFNSGDPGDPGWSLNVEFCCH